MPGTMFIQADALAALPTSGTAWDALVAKSTTNPGTGNLAALDQPHALAVFSIALRWARDGGGFGDTYVIDEIKAVMGTESTLVRELYPFRSIAAYILAADLVDMPGSSIGANGQTFTQWVQGLPNFNIPSAPAVSATMYKAARQQPNYWGSFARASLLACSLWMIKAGVDPTGSGFTGTAAQLRDETVGYLKRWLGDTSVTNTFVTPSNYNPAWAINSFPTTQGAVNPVSTDLTRSGADIIEASLSGAPPLTGGAGKRQTYEVLDAVDTATIMAINAGYTDAAGWGNNAVRRVYEFLEVNNLTTTDSDYNKNHWHQAFFANFLFPGLNFPVPTQDAARPQRRLLTTHVDWLTAAGSTWLGTTAPGGGGAPVIVNPTVSFTLDRVDQTVTMDATGSSAGSAAITRHIITWGDNSADSTITEPTRTATHTYDGGQTYTVTVRAEASDGGQATAQQTVSVPAANNAPVVNFTVSKSTVQPGEELAYSFEGSLDPTGTGLTYTVDWGDGTLVTDAPEFGTHTYEEPDESSSFLVAGEAATLDAAAPPVTRTVTVLAAGAKQYGEMFVGVNGTATPVLPAFDSTWDGFHLKLGAHRAWVDATGTWRIKNGAPTSDLDGVPLGAGGGAGVVVVSPGENPPPGTPAGTIIFEA